MHLINAEHIQSLTQALHEFLGSAPTVLSLFICRVNILLRINYRPNGRRPLKRLLGEAKTGFVFF
jgi:hypothetical protein